MLLPLASKTMLYRSLHIQHSNPLSTKHVEVYEAQDLRQARERAEERWEPEPGDHIVVLSLDENQCKAYEHE